MPAFTLAGVPVRLHFTFVLFVLFLLISELARWSSPTFGIFLLGLFASVLMHELAHVSVAGKLRVRTVEIVMFPIGGVSRLERGISPTEELVIAAAGPLVNLLISAIIFGCMWYTRQAIVIDPNALLVPSDGNIMQRLAFANLLLAGFNLIPAFPMDGGRMMRALLSFIRPEAEATRIAAWTGRMLAISMGVYGIVFSYLLLVFFAVFIWLGAAQEAAAAMGRSLTAGVPIRAAMMTEFHCLDHSATVREAANLLLSTAQEDFPVLHGDSVVGLIDRNLLVQALAAQGPDGYVAGGMARDFLTLPPDADLAQHLPILARNGRCAVVMDGDRLIGLLTSDNLAEFLLLRRFGLDPVL